MLVAGASPARPPRPSGELILDAAAPIIAVNLDGTTLRLRVDLDQWDSIELNPDVAARLPLPWEMGRDLSIGRTTLTGRTAVAKLAIGRTIRPVLVATHGRAATADAEGTIGPDLLPYASVTWRRADAPPPSGTVTLPLRLDDQRGLDAAAPDLAPGLSLRFSLANPETAATAAAGALLAQRLGGAFEGAVRPIPVTLGITRPARTIRFGRPFRLAGFRFDRLPVRIADFRGDNPLPTDPAPPADITVARRERPQGAEPWVALGLDRLGRCAEITYRADPRSLSLACAFEP
jgi:hypothetical protein